MLCQYSYLASGLCLEEQYLLEANLKNDTARLDEVTRLLGEVKNAWASIAPNPVR